MINEKYIRVLNIDLTTSTVKIDQRPDLLPYLGGVGVASKLLEENMHADLDPYHPDQPIIFAIGAGTWVFPVLTKTVAMFRSPLTNELGESYAGGRLAMTLLMAGYDAVVIKGKSIKPVCLTIKNNDVMFSDARALWGMDSEPTGLAIRERAEGSGKRSIIRIGPAGENKVAFASVCVDSYRHFGRLGLGAVMGSKNLKAMTVTGDRSIPIKDTKGYFKVYQSIYKKCTSTDMMQKYHDAGTAIGLLSLSASNSLPTYNLKTTTYEHADAISGEEFAKKNLVRKQACTGCPVGCIHIGMYRREFDKGHEYEAISVPYDYELMFALGSYLGIQTTDDIIALIEEVEETGMDAISAGVCLGWATEAVENGLIDETQTLVPLRFGDTENYLKAIRLLAKGKNKFYRDLGRGSKYAATVYGGEDYAMHYAGNETPGYHTGYASAVGFAVASRHSHLDNGGYQIDMSVKEVDPEDLVEKIFFEEHDRCMVNGLGMCMFARKIYDHQTILDALNSIGWKLTDEDLDQIGKRILRTKLRIKAQFGFSQKAVRLPKRFFETPTMHGQLEEATVNKMIKMFIGKTNDLMSTPDLVLEAAANAQTPAPPAKPNARAAT
jgi:aldehyde:ferredoxin oxidoreductase